MQCRIESSLRQCDVLFGVYCRVCSAQCIVYSIGIGYTRILGISTAQKKSGRRRRRDVDTGDGAAVHRDVAAWRGARSRPPCSFLVYVFVNVYDNKLSSFTIWNKATDGNGNWDNRYGAEFMNAKERRRVKSTTRNSKKLFQWAGHWDKACNHEQWKIKCLHYFIIIYDIWCGNMLNCSVAYFSILGIYVFINENIYLFIYLLTPSSTSHVFSWAAFLYFHIDTM